MTLMDTLSQWLWWTLFLNDFVGHSFAGEEQIGTTIIQAHEQYICDVT